MFSRFLLIALAAGFSRTQGLLFLLAVPVGVVFFTPLVVFLSTGRLIDHSWRIRNFEEPEYPPTNWLVVTTTVALLLGFMTVVAWLSVESVGH